MFAVYVPQCTKVCTSNYLNTIKFTKNEKKHNSGKQDFVCAMCYAYAHTLTTNKLVLLRTHPKFKQKKSRHRAFYSVYKQLNRFSGFRFRCCCCVFADLWNKQYTLHTRFNHRSFQLFYFSIWSAHLLIRSFHRIFIRLFGCHFVSFAHIRLNAVPNCQ